MLLPFMELSSFSVQQWNEPIKWSHFMSLAPFSLRVRVSASALPPLIRPPIALKRVSLSSPLLPCLATVAFPVPPKGGKPSTPALAFRILEQTSVSRIPPYLHVVLVGLSAGWKRISRHRPFQREWFYYSEQRAGMWGHCEHSGLTTWQTRESWLRTVGQLQRADPFRGLLVSFYSLKTKFLLKGWH